MLQLKDFRKESEAVISWIDHYLNHIGEFPVKSKVKPGEIYGQIPRSAPSDPESMVAIMKDLDEVILPGITHWQHPNYHAYFPANNSVESIFAEFLVAAIGAQCMIWETSPAAAELEQRMMEWLRDAMGLPSFFEGVIQESASSSNLVALITAREAITDHKSNRTGSPPHLRVYCSSETHSSVDKAVAICGIGRENLVKVGVDEKMRMDPALLEEQIRKDKDAGFTPCAVMATLGTTGTLGVDPLEPIAALCKKHNIWLHVDAAFAGTALLLPEYRWMINGIEQVDSFVFNPHKWMFTNFDCSVYFVKDPGHLIRTFEVTPEYLNTGTRGEVNDYKDWGIPLGRRFRALKLWFVMRSYGIRGIQDKLRYHIDLNRIFSDRITKSGDFVLVQEPFLNFTTFRLHPTGIASPKLLNDLNKQLMERVNSRGKIFLTHTKVGGLVTLRFVVGQTYVNEKHLETAWGELELAAKVATERMKGAAK